MGTAGGKHSNIVYKYYEDCFCYVHSFAPARVKNKEM